MTPAIFRPEASKRTRAHYRIERPEIISTDQTKLKEEKEELELSSISDGEGAKKHGASQGWDLSGWPMLLLLMPPFGFLQLAQPIKNLFEWDLPFLAVPVLLLIAIPAYQHFIVEQGAGWHASSKGAGGDEGLAEGLTEGMAEEPDKPPPDVTAL